jgi:phenazine biosynthesis protein phzE
MGMEVDVVRYSSFDLADYTDHDLVVVGPGTGNPNDQTSEKMRKVVAVTEQLLAANRPFLSICLGHQVLCRVLGLEVKRKEETFQGVPKKIDFFGQPQIVGFYNTFSGFYHTTDANKPISVSYDTKTGEIYALKHREKNCIGLQFHPESILTQRGYEILKEAATALLG